MKILFAIPELSSNLCQCLKSDGTIADSFDVEWRTPDDDASLKIRELRIETLDYYANSPKIHTIDDFRESVNKLKQLRADIDTVITEHFVRVADDPSYEDGDLQRMLAHDIYRGGLLVSLYGVTNGELKTKNSPKPDMSGQQDDSPAVEVKDSSQL